MDDIFFGILEADPKAHIILLESLARSGSQSKLTKRQSHHDINGKRIHFLPPLPFSDYMSLLCGGYANVFLDPIPFGGGVTALEALSCDLPIVTSPSQTTVHQLGSGFVKAMRLDKTTQDHMIVVGDSIEEYVKKAISIASSPSLRDQLSLAISSNKHKLFEDSHENVIREWENLLQRLFDH